jgi:hypothetical protein
MPISSWIDRGKRLLSGRRPAVDSPTTAIERGESYLLARLRARQIVSRAPVESTNKWFDDCGEPFLALDVVIALGEHMPDPERQKLIARLLQSEREGGWVYAPFGDIDADTTASALRALHRLGYDASGRGVDVFFNPRTGLYTTYYGPKFVDRELGLQLAPQSLPKHRGSHPCVLANVYLLLHERGELPALSHDLLRRLQQPGGNWFSYHYPSPYYATRLFTELLASLGAEYDVYLRSTLNALLAGETPGSPTQAAEVLISLDHLRRRFIADSDAIVDKGGTLARHILAAQLRDGSWPGDVIWEYFDEKTPWIIGFDQFRVRSTALCVRALKLWDVTSA